MSSMEGDQKIYIQHRTEENQGTKPEADEDKSRFMMRIFSPCMSPEPRVLAPALASMKASCTSGSPRYCNSGGHERERRREEGAQCSLLTLKYKVPVPQPAMPPEERPGHESGATVVSIWSCPSKSLSSPPPSWPWCSHHRPRTHDTSSSNPPHPSHCPSCS